MKIGISTFGGDGGKSGISHYIINMLAQFEALDADHTYDVMVFESEREIFIPKNAKKLRAMEFPETFKSPIKSIYWHQRTLPKICKREGYDVMFLPAANRRTCLSLPCPMAGVVHDFSSIHVKGKYDPARMFYIRHVLPAMIRKLNHVITISQSSRKDIVEYAKVPDNRVTIIPLAADHETYKPGDREAARKFIKEKYNIDSPYVLYTSRLEHPGKNHARLIEAFNQVKSANNVPHKLVLAGSDWSGAEAIHEAAAKSPYRDSIIFPGFVPGADLISFYRGAEIFIFPSLYEGFGLPILEAMACGVATTCSNISSMPEVAGDAAPTFDPYDPEEIAKPLSKLILNPEWRTEVEQAGIQRALGFNWKKTARSTLDILERLGKKER